MTDLRRIYYYLIIGGLGGLTGWLIGTLAVRVLDFPTHSLRSLTIYGGIVGASIGIAVTGYDGLVNRSVFRLVKFGAVGLAIGALAGGLALPLSDRLWLYFSSRTPGGVAPATDSWQGVLIGTLCWILVGGLIGLGEGVSKGTQIWKSVLGGLTGGLGGGLLVELTTNEATDFTKVRDQFFVALNLLVLGAAIGAAIACVTEVLKRAWLEVQDGKLAGREYDVTKYVDRVLGRHRPGVIGSDKWRAHIYLPGDGAVSPLHATINFVNGAPTLTVSPDARGRSITLVNGRQLATSTPLSDGDQLQFGSTRVVYRQKRRR